MVPDINIFDRCYFFMELFTMPHIIIIKQQMHPWTFTLRNGPAFLFNYHIASKREFRQVPAVRCIEKKIEAAMVKIKQPTPVLFGY